MSSSDGPADLAALLSATAAGDQQAFASVYDATAPRVFGLVLRVVRDRAQAEEVTQEVFLQVWRSAGSFDAARGSALAWILTLAHRRAVDRVRSAVARTAREDVYESRQVSGPYDSTAEVVEERMEARRVRSALERLSETQRAAIELAFFEGLTHPEVSDRLGVPLGTAKTRIRDGLHRLRNQLGGAS
jgi:RNA polymerase sigma-70 factor (ECF subfamily)